MKRKLCRLVALLFAPICDVNSLEMEAPRPTHLRPLLSIPQQGAVAEWVGDALVLSTVDGSILTFDLWSGRPRGRAEPTMTGGPLLRGSDSWTSAPDWVTQRIVPALDGTLFSLLEHSTNSYSQSPRQEQYVQQSVSPTLFQLEELPLKIQDLVDRPVSLCFSNSATAQECGIILGHKSTQVLALNPNNGQVRSLHGPAPNNHQTSVVFLQRMQYSVHQVHVQTGIDMWNVSFGQVASLDFTADPALTDLQTISSDDESIMPWIYIHQDTTNSPHKIQTILALDPNTLQILWSQPIHSLVVTAHGISKKHDLHPIHEYRWSSLHLIDSLPLTTLNTLPGIQQPEQDLSLVPFHYDPSIQHNNPNKSSWAWLLIQDPNMDNHSPLIIRPTPTLSSSSLTISSPTSLDTHSLENSLSPDFMEATTDECIDTFPWEYYEEDESPIEPYPSFTRYTTSHKTEHGLFLSWRLVTAIASCLILGILGGRIVYIRKKQKWIAESSTPKFMTLFPNSNSEDVGPPSPLLLATHQSAELSPPAPAPPPPLTLVSSTLHSSTTSTVTHMDGIPLVRYLRYRSEFDELESLGQGGFGTVFKCMNKLDGREYAIKKVSIPSPLDKNGQRNPHFSKRFHRVLREVKILALLDHPNIVRYYTAWLEMEEDVNSLEESVDRSFEQGQSMISESCTSTRTNTINRGFSSDFLVGQAPWMQPLHSPRTLMEDDLGFVWEENSPKSTSHASFTIEDSSNRSVREESPREVEFSVYNRDDSCGVSQGPSNTTHGMDENVLDDNVKIQQHILYIQMQLSKKTLLDYFSARHAPRSTSSSISVDIPVVLRMFAHIAHGVNHVHRQGLIHRDLKPSNCFMDDSDLVKIGDFGLSRESGVFADDDEGSTSIKAIDMMENTAGIGTSSYASPEQMNGSDYDASTDVYSLGIILFELCYPMITGMERFKAFEGIRKPTPQFPTTWYSTVAKQFPIIHTLIISMISHNPKDRPTASQVSKQIEAILSEYKTILLLDRPGVKRQDGSVFLRVEGIDSDGILARMIQTIKGISQDITIAQYSLQGHENKAIMEFALILKSEVTAETGSEVRFEISNQNLLRKILEALENCDEVKLVRQVKNEKFSVTDSLE